MRSKLSRDQWLAVALFLLMLIMVVVTVLQEQAETELPALTSFSNQPDGARALYLWLEALGYRPDNRSGQLYTIPDEATMVLLLEPLLPPQEAELRQLENWVEEGGVLLLAGRGFSAQQALAYFEVRLRFASLLETAEFQPTSPLWQSPPLTDPPQWPQRTYLTSEQADVTVQGVVNGRAVLLSRSLGEGQLWLASDATILTNEGLQQPGSAELVQNLVSQIEAGGLIWFDDWHQGIQPQDATVADINDWLRQTPMGQAILLLAGLLFVGLVLRGRPFGPPVPLPQQSRRRAPLEYITAIANLSRRAGHNRAIAQDYQQRLKRHLAHRYRLNPNLPHADFVQQLAAYDPNLDADRLLALLNQLSQPRLSEAELVRLATAVAKWTERET